MILLTKNNKPITDMKVDGYFSPQLVEIVT